MRRIMAHLVMGILTIAFFLASSVSVAADAFHPSRVRLLLHGGYDVSETTRLEMRFVPAGNLLGDLAPLTYLGVKARTNNWLTVEPYAGWHFGKDEPLVSLSFNPHHPRVWGWTATDWYPLSGDGYWFAQWDYQLSDWLHLGVEGEGWGNFADASSWSHGAGPNALLRFGKDGRVTSGLDIAVHERTLEGSTKTELFVRAHVWL